MPEVLIDEETWKQKRAAEPETATHPCDHWDHTECMCKGACSCHWKEEPSVQQDTVKVLRGIVGQFQCLCMEARVDLRDQSFTRFHGAMAKYVDLLEKAAVMKTGSISVSQYNTVPVADHDMAYLGSQLREIFQPMLNDNHAKWTLYNALFRTKKT